MKARIQLKNIGFVIKHQQPEASALALELAKFILSKGYVVAFCDESKPVAKKLQEAASRSSKKVGSKKIKVVPKIKLVDVTDLILVLGGDGTFLSIARLMRSRS